jgi:hypothetical protein
MSWLVSLKLTTVIPAPSYANLSPAHGAASIYGIKPCHLEYGIATIN